MNSLFDMPSAELARRYAMETPQVKVSPNLLTQLVLQNNLQSRTSIMITASFNVAAATVMIFSIVYDAWKLSKRCILAPPARGRLGFLRKIHSAEVFPLVLSTAIVMQGVIFLTAQGMGLQSLFFESCMEISRFIWPAVWIVGFVLLVFGSEAVYRGLKKDRFAPRGRWNTPICWIVVAIMLTLTSIAPLIRPRPDDRCVASLLIWASPWSDIAIILTSSLIFLYIVIALILTVQLVRTSKIEREERIAASRIVYYLAIGVAVFSFALPFWVQNTYMRNTVVSSSMAAVALNIFGIVNMFMHLLLRSNADNMAIRPLNSSWRKHRSWRLFGSTDLDTSMAQHITTPIGLARNDKHARLALNDKGEDSPDLEAGHRSIAQSESSDRSEGRKAFPAFAQFPNAPIASRHTRKMSNYSLFPPVPNRSKGNDPGLPNSNEENIALLPPRAAFIRRHTRFSSSISSATVQIGLRLSNMATADRQGVNASTTSLTVPPQSTRGTSNTQPSTPIHQAVHDSCTLDLPVRFDGIPGSERSSSRVSEKIQTMLSARRYLRRRTASLSGSFQLNSPVGGDDRNGSMEEVIPPPPLSVAKGKRVTETPIPEPAPSEPPSDQWPLPDGLLLLPNKKYEPTKSWI